MLLLLFSSYMICHRICKTGATSVADSAYSSGEPGVTPFSSYMICHRICNTGATSGADITYSSGEPGENPVVFLHDLS